jgi:hypothetical protein
MSSNLGCRARQSATQIAGRICQQALLVARKSGEWYHPAGVAGDDPAQS